MNRSTTQFIPIPVVLVGDMRTWKIRMTMHPCIPLAFSYDLYEYLYKFTGMVGWGHGVGPWTIQCYRNPGFCHVRMDTGCGHLEQVRTVIITWRMRFGRWMAKSDQCNLLYIESKCVTPYSPCQSLVPFSEIRRPPDVQTNSINCTKISRFIVNILHCRKLVSDNDVYLQ